MQPLRTYSVIPKLPEKLTPLWDLAYNCWFAWNHGIAGLFSTIDHELWKESNANPVAFLNRLPQQVLEELAADEFFLQRMNEQLQSLKQYAGRVAPYREFPVGDGSNRVVAYLSFEYGIVGCLPIYSGGLGILAGDHLKSASDLNLPLVAVGLCYREGYFRQYLTPDGWQQERYPDSDFEQLPMRLCKDEGGRPVVVRVEINGSSIAAQIWRVEVGRVNLYLLDANIPDNPPPLRELTSRLYGGDLEMRLKQEILLGMGGIRALSALGYSPMVVHMNEGHSAFAGLERVRAYMHDHGLDFEAAMEMVASTSVFTTHTPVPAGNDRFPEEMMRPYFEHFAGSLGLAWKVFMALGREDVRDESEHFCMTVLALRLARFSNGVSKLHGKVSRRLWSKVWPQYPVEDVPIGGLTNGVHMPTWVAPDMALVYDRYLGADWREDPDCARVWENAANIPDAELWRTHERLRERLVDFVRARLKRQLVDRGARPQEVRNAGEVLDPQALTVGFARRFATYKRADLILKDVERVKALLADKKRPVQFIFAGKAHPADNAGKELIQELIQLCRDEATRLAMVFIEDYDMEVALHMVQGCDVWVNTPRRPLEACGTSGMKAMANGVLQFSTLDGWWDEAYLSDNSVGFAIGRGEEYPDLQYQDFVESQTLYTVLENDIIPDFYDRGHGNLPRGWIAKMKNALRLLGPEFNSHRMVEDYAATAYIPALESAMALSADEFAPAKSLSRWRMKLMTKWGELDIRTVRCESEEQVFVAEPVRVEAEVYLGAISPEHVQVELYHGVLDKKGEFIRRHTSPMSIQADLGEGRLLYGGEVAADEAGRFGFTVRILPRHELLANPHSLGLIKWAEA